MTFKFITKKDKNKIIGAEIINFIKEEETGHIGYMLETKSGEKIIISAKELFISRNVNKSN